LNLDIRRFQARDVEPIRRLNDRLRAAGVEHRVYSEDSDDSNGPDDAARCITERLFVAADAQEIRGGVWLKEHDFWVHGQLVSAGWAKYPVAESVIRSEYSGVPGSLMLQLLHEQPRLMALGLGGQESPFARLLLRMGWVASTIPFYFLIAHPRRVLRELSYVRRSAWRRVVMDALAVSGLGWLACKFLSAVRRVAHAGNAVAYTADIVEGFGDWADVIWERCRDCYGLVGLRSSRMLNIVYPESSHGLSRLRVRRDGQDVGWACVVRDDLREGPADRFFGRLAVGVIADCLADPADAAGVIAAATRHLLASDVDLIFSNQAHPSWVSSLRASGFMPGPSNFAFCRAPAMEKSLQYASVTAKGIHVNRGDCDGPIWLGKQETA
jgi:hypothetical protein